MSLNIQNYVYMVDLYIDGAQVGTPDKTYRSLDTNPVSESHMYAISLNANQTVTPYFQTSGDTSSTIRIGARFSGFLIA